MPRPSKLAITASTVSRLVKEEASYHKEQAQQEARIKHLEENPSTGENAEFEFNQERRALDETKAIFPPLHKRISEAVAQLKQQLETDEASASPEDVSKARDALTQAEAVAA